MIQNLALLHYIENLSDPKTFIVFYFMRISMSFELSFFQKVNLDKYFRNSKGNEFQTNDPMGPLQLTVTWYKIHHVGEQATHWDIQNKENSSVIG